MGWNYRFERTSPIVGTFWHFWNAFLCGVVGFFFAAISPSVMAMLTPNGVAQYALLGLVFSFPFVLASWRSGGKSVRLGWHLVHSLVGLGVVLLAATLPISEGSYSGEWLFLIGFICLVIVSWMSDSTRGRRSGSHESAPA